MYLFVFDYETGNIDIIRDVPENIDDIESFVTDVLGYHLTSVEYMLTKDENIINVTDYDEKDYSLIDVYSDYIYNKF